MRTGPATAEEITAAFEELIASAPDDPISSENPLDWQTMDAVQRVWAAGPEPPPRLVELAHIELAAQLDGTHEREDQAARCISPGGENDRTCG